MVQWNKGFDTVGFLSDIFQEDDPRTVQEQANTNYAHGGGWMSFMGRGFQLAGDKQDGFHLTYAGDPPQRERARAQFRKQLLVLFDSAWVGIIEADGTLSDVSRMD